MKKILLVGLMMLSLLALSACRSEKLYTLNFLDYMDTFIQVQVSANSETEANNYQEEIDNIFSMYHELSTAYEPLYSDSEYLENIYSINMKVGQKLEIDKPLYELLYYSEEIKALTDGYFDISIGKSVDVWKHVMDQVTDGFEIGESVYVYYYYDGEKTEENKVIVNASGIIESIETDDNDQDVVLSISLNIGEEIITIDKEDIYYKEVSKTTYDNALVEINKLDFSNNAIVLEIEDDKYFVTINGDDIKLDLGAISKGYATQKVYQYILSKDIAYYSISSGTSSIILGENKNRSDEDYVYYISLANPYKLEFSDKDTYGTIKVKNMSVTTSGNYEQYVLYQGDRYHHIVSPFKKMPEQFYHTVTILGPDAGLLDALSTALFSMSPEIMDAWILKHQEELQIEIIRFNQNLTVDTFMIDTEFEEH